MNGDQVVNPSNLSQTSGPPQRRLTQVHQVKVDLNLRVIPKEVSRRFDAGLGTSAGQHQEVDFLLPSLSQPVQLGTNLVVGDPQSIADRLTIRLIQPEVNTTFTPCSRCRQPRRDGVDTIERRARGHTVANGVTDEVRPIKKEAHPLGSQEPALLAQEESHGIPVEDHPHHDGEGEQVHHPPCPHVSVRAVLERVPDRALTVQNREFEGEAVIRHARHDVLGEEFTPRLHPTIDRKTGISNLSRWGRHDFPPRCNEF
ncbi:MAG: hypothetical protein COV59_01445 [Candidatus Magasanikbacteria bacterium CG11_big_fil_rev_8_21_14_0_20_39_34]|uniref:Uncharacterized protein n=1 Tax=Candidatus Magasanikbacteria bacterium CG11_big_fil_rev_8_21_14_0_20_39_34 TaxID=1974653 RepID=A0A2H0N5X0_9BACT|nr:MAG: hypothetical protein COV59_01445 [Candidatus Magasanikbacteria bacterium CG11_big_fil_rev_8_21_14_0_20_39_34]